MGMKGRIIAHEMEIGSTIIILTLIGIASYLAVRFYRTDKKVEHAEKISAYLSPITVESAKKMLEGKGYKIEGIHNDGKDITFSVNDTRFNLDLERQPLTFLYLGYGIDDELDKDALARAAAKVTDDIVMVKVNVHDDGYNYLIACCESCIGHLDESLDKYMEILEDAQRKMSDAYHEYLGEKHGREQAQADMIPPVDCQEEQSAKIVS